MNPLSVLNKVPTWAYLAAAGVAVLYVVKKGGLQNAAAGVTEGVINGAGNVVIGAATGAVTGIGGLAGLPATNLTDCQKAIMNADNGRASVYCSAGVFTKWQYLSARKRLTGQTFTMSDIFN